MSVKLFSIFCGVFSVRSAPRKLSLDHDSSPSPLLSRRPRSYSESTTSLGNPSLKEPYLPSHRAQNPKPKCPSKTTADRTDPNVLYPRLSAVVGGTMRLLQRYVYPLGSWNQWEADDEQDALGRMLLGSAMRSHMGEAEFATTQYQIRICASYGVANCLEQSRYLAFLLHLLLPDIVQIRALRNNPSNKNPHPYPSRFHNDHVFLCLVPGRELRERLIVDPWPASQSVSLQPMVRPELHFSRELPHEEQAVFG